MSRTAGLTPGSLAEYDPPGYLYQGAEINGQMIKYTTLPGTSRANGSVHGSFISSSTGSGCPHHHKAARGLDGATNGGVGLHSSSLPGAHLDCERAHRMVNVSLGAAMGVVLGGGGTHPLVTAERLLPGEATGLMFLIQTSWFSSENIR